MMLKAYEVAKLITDKHSAKQIKMVRINNEFRYIVRDLTQAEYDFYSDGEHLEETGDKPKPSRWFMLDAFSASAVKQIYEALTDKSKFDRISMPRLVEFAFKFTR